MSVFHAQNKGFRGGFQSVTSGINRYINGYSGGMMTDQTPTVEIDPRSLSPVGRMAIQAERGEAARHRIEFALGRPIPSTENLLETIADLAERVAHLERVTPPGDGRA